MPQNPKQRDEAAAAERTDVASAIREGKRWYLTALLVFLLLALGVVLYLLKYKPMEFFYVLF